MNPNNKATALLLLSGLVLGLLVLPHVWMQPTTAGPLPAAHDLDVTTLRRPGIVDAGSASSSSNLLQCNDPYEPNDSFANAWFLSPGTIQSYVCCEWNDYDYFKFSANAGDPIRLDLYDLPADYNLCLFKPNQTPVACSENGGATAENIDWVATSSGKHYALIFGVQGACDSKLPYTFELKVTAPTSTPTSTPTRTPTPTHTPTATPTATPQPPELELIKTLLRPIGGFAVVSDTVRFEIFLENTGPTDITKLPLTDVFSDTCLSYITASPPPDNKVSNTLLWYDLGRLSVGDNRTVTVDFHADSPCDPAVNRAGVSTAKDEYGRPVPGRLDDATVIIVACPDAYDPNDAFADAYLLDPLDPAGYRAYVCTPFDEDYFRFSAALWDEIRVELDELPANYDLELWDPTETLVAASRNAGTARERISFVASNFAGEYRVRVVGAAGAFNNSKTYHLTIGVTSTTPPALVVNTTGDEDNGTCNVAHCSLREAISAVNAGVGRQVEFDIPTGDPGFDWLVWTIQPAAPLPTITQRIDLDATTQTANQGNSNPDGPEIVLDGSLAGSGANGLLLDGTSSSTIRGLVISNWDEAGIRSEGSIQTHVIGCYVGADPFGVAAAGNKDGIVLVGGHSHHIGDSAAGEGNLISGNRGHGLHLSGTAYAQVKANLIGTDRTGMAELGNVKSGIYLSDDAEWNTLGGDRDSEGNLISANWKDGVQMDGAGTSYNRLWGNRIGVNATMTEPLGNHGDGVAVYDGHHNQIGSDEAGKGNVIGGNILGIAGSGAGICLNDAHLNTVEGNFIGAEPSETYHLGNAGSGVSVGAGSQLNTIGPGNVIAHNSVDGVLVMHDTTARNTITRNSITDNGGLGIATEAGGNENLPPPIISRDALTYVEGAACSRCWVEIFSDPAGEGEIYEGTVRATAYGAWTWHGSTFWGPANVTATATDSDGNTSEFSACHDEYEPNEDFAHATAIGSEDEIESYICHRDDVDYFRFPVVAPPSLIGVELIAPEFYELRLYDPDQALLQMRRIRTGSTYHRALESGDYFVKVNAEDRWSYDPNSPYTLRVTQEAIENIDFQGFGLEVTQAIQDLNNSVDLVSNKRTYARFHVRSLTHGDLGPVTARLTAWRGSFAQGSIMPNNPGGAITVREDPDRGELEHSFYFDLPDSWLHGSLRLTAEVNPAHSPPESGYANNTQTVDVTFLETPEMHLRMVDACYITDTITYHVHDEDRLALESWLRRAYPIDRLHVEWSTKSPCFDHWPSCDEVNAHLVEARSLNLYGDDSVHPNMRYYGMTDDGYFRTIGSCGGGKANGIPSMEACGRAGNPGGWCYGWDTDGSYADWLGGHELGHSYDRAHAEFCGAGGGRPYPHPDGDISPTQDGSHPIALYGFDVETLAIYPPDWKELMTYCDYRWVSDFTYEGIRDRMIIETARAATLARPAATQEYLALFGTVHSDTHKVELDTFYRLPDGWDVLGRVPGEYSIQLLDGEADTLADYPFTPKFNHVDPGPTSPAGTQEEEEEEEVTGLMAVFVPWMTGTARIAIYHGDQELASRPVSAHIPQVTISYPNGGELLNGDQIEVSWEASDADGDALSYTLQYSADGGARWQVLGTGITTTTLRLDAAVVPGSDQGKFRVLASDGVNTAQDESDSTFTVPNKAPRVWIVSPLDGASYVLGGC